MVDESVNRDKISEKPADNVDSNNGVQSFRNEVYSAQNNSLTNHEKPEDSQSSKSLPKLILDQNNISGNAKLDSKNGTAPENYNAKHDLAGNKGKNVDDAAKHLATSLRLELGRSSQPSQEIIKELGRKPLSSDDMKDNGSRNAKEVMEKLAPKEGKLEDLIKPEDLSELMMWKPTGRDGVEKLSTGDHIVRQDGKEHLFTKGGDRVTVNADGSAEISGNVKAFKTDKNDVTTVTFSDNSQVAFDKHGIRSVSRDGQTAVVGKRLEEIVKPTLPAPPKYPGDPWPLPGRPGIDLPGGRAPGAPWPPELPGLPGTDLPGRNPPSPWPDPKYPHGDSVQLLKNKNAAGKTRK